MAGHASGVGDVACIVGAGAVTPLGADLPSSWRALLAGEVALRAGLERLDQALRDYPVGEALLAPALEREGLAAAELRKLDRVTQAALAAAGEALRDAGLPERLDDARTGIVLGIGYGASGTHLESVGRIRDGRAARLSPYTIPASMPNAAAAQLALRHGLRGPALTVGTACASGLDAVGVALLLLRSGACDRVLTGGAEMIDDDLGVGGMAAARALSRVGEDGDPRVLRPFDRARKGTAVGTGAALFVLETPAAAAARGATVRARVAGYGCAADAHHITAPEPGGAGAEAAMRAALADATRATGDAGFAAGGAEAAARIGAVFAHGTGTPLNDRMEGLAIARVFGADGPAVTSTKGQYGHAMGASGAFHLAFALHAMADGVVPATLPCDDPDPDCAVLPVTGAHDEGALGGCLVNAFGFGGHDASLVVVGG